MTDAEIEAVMRELLDCGHAEVVGVTDDGELKYRITDEGRAHVENVLLPRLRRGSTPEGDDT